MVHVHLRARQAILGMDAALRQELIEHVELVDQDPHEMLLRAEPESPVPGGSLSTFRSRSVPELTVRVYYVGFDDDPPRLDIIAITQTIDDQGHR
jgi:hypothetical protein